MKKIFLMIGMLLTMGLATAVFNACSKDDDKSGQEQTDPNNPNNPEEPTNPGQPIETDDFKIGAFNVSSKTFTGQAVNFNAPFTFAIEIKSDKFKAAVDAAATGAGGTSRTLAFFEARYTLEGSGTETNLAAPANEERLTRLPGTYIFYKENYSTGRTLAEGTKGNIHFQVLVAEVGSSYWWSESNAAGTIEYGGYIPFAVPSSGSTDPGGDDYRYDGELILDNTVFNIHIGEMVMLMATFEFSGDNINRTQWSNSNSAVVQSETSGIIIQYITGLSAGTSIITIKVANKTATCTVNVSGALANNNGVVINGTRWANRNTAAPNTFAAKAENSGMFYQWNSKIGWSTTDPITSSPSGNTWNQNWNGGGATTWETTNNVCPSGWRVPTVAELESLTNAERRRAIINDVQGSVYGSGENAIFLPDAGLRGNYGTLQTNGYQLNFYWSNSATSSSNAQHLRSGDSYVTGISSYSTNTALPVRCVAQ